MGKAFVCAISGKIGAGEGVKVQTVQFSKQLKAEVRYFELQNGAYVHAEVSPEEAKKVEAAVLGAVKVVETAEKKG